MTPRIHRLVELAQAAARAESEYHRAAEEANRCEAALKQAQLSVDMKASQWRAAVRERDSAAARSVEARRALEMASEGASWSSDGA